MSKRFLILFFLLFAYALSAYSQVDKREVRQGNRKFKKEQFTEAEIAYRKGLVKDSLSIASTYNLASTLYRKNDFEGAKAVIEKLDGIRDLSADIHYNMGDIALQLKDYATAVDAFKESLLLNPGDLDAKENYIYAKLMLDNQQNEQEQNQNQDQNQDQNDDQEQNQDQNQDQNQGDGGGGGGSQDQSSISQQQAQQMLNAVQANEQKTRDKVERLKAEEQQSRQKEKNW